MQNDSPWSGGPSDSTPPSVGWTKRHYLGIAVASIGLLAIAWIVWTESRPTATVSSLPNPVAMQRTDGSASLRQALDLLNRVDEFDFSRAHEQILKQLNQWVATRPVDADWTPDGFVEQLPDVYREMVAPSYLGRDDFELYDAQMLQEATWLRDVAKSVIQFSQPSPRIAGLIEQIKQTVKNAHVQDVTQALRLFDWTFRNLQLDAEVRPGDQHRFNSDVILQAWESLLFGRGTLSENSRVFILMCRQLGLTAVMLAVDRDPGQAAPRAWLPALLLDDQLYLFDMRLGVAIPGPGNQGIATLQQIVEKPSLLERLELFPDYLYPVKAADLDSIVALIDATPPYLSRRMKMLESALVGEEKRVLTVSPSSIATALAACPGLQGVGISTVPYDGFVVRGRIQANEMAVISLGIEHSLFDRQTTPLGPARIRHFRGEFDGDDDQPGARALYLECRTSEDQINSVASIPLQMDQGAPTVAPTAEQVEAHERRLANIQFLMRRTKENASYWLGFMAFDRGEYEIAIDFWDQRLLQVNANTQWRAGAIYNLGRATEALGRANDDTAMIQAAAEIYASLLDVPLAAACQYLARELSEELAAGRNATETGAEPDSSPELDVVDAAASAPTDPPKNPRSDEVDRSTPVDELPTESTGR